MPAMRLRRSLIPALAAVLLAGCVTAPPSRTPPLAPEDLARETAGYRGPADAARILAALDQQLAARHGAPADLATPELTTYAHLLLAAGRLKDAEASLSVLADRTPGDRTTLYALAALAGARGDLATQATRLTALEAAHPGDPGAGNLRARAALARGDKAGAQKAWSAVVAQGEDPEALAGLAQLALDAGAPGQALSLVNRALSPSPDDDQGLGLRARIQTELKNFRAARQDLDRAVALAPDDPWHRLDRGKLAWLHLYDLGLARTDLEWVTARLPQNLMAWEALAEVNEEEGQGPAAFDAWKRVLELRPDYRFAYPSGAMLAFRYRDFARAAPLAHQAALDHPAEFAFPFVEALSLRYLGRPAEAQTVLEKARPRFLKNPTVTEMFRFLTTPGSEYYLEGALKIEKQENVRLRLRFYQGCQYAFSKAWNSARAAFQEVGDGTLLHIPEIAAARDWLDHGP